MPSYLITPNELCLEHERAEALTLVKEHILSRFGQIEMFKEGDGFFSFQTEKDDVLSFEDRFIWPILQMFPWLDFKETRDVKVLTPLLPDSEFGEYRSRHRFFSIDWVQGLVYDDDGKIKALSEVLDDSLGIASSFMFPDAIECEYGGVALQVRISHSLDRVKFESADEMLSYASGYARIDDEWVRCDYARRIAFRYKGRLGRPVDHMFKGNIRGNKYLPIDFSPFAMQNSMRVWLPSAMRHARTPETRMFPIPGDFESLYDNKKPPCFDTYCRTLEEYARGRSLPLFLRSDFTSNKHSFDSTCRLADPSNVGKQLALIHEFAGIADLPCTAYALRSWIPGPCAWKERSFDDMPVRKEFRFFVEGRRIGHVQPYWPEKAFEMSRSLPGDWRERLLKLTHLTSDEFCDLSRRSLAIAEDLGGDWSVDWLSSDDGWWLTDMACASVSYRYDPPEEWKRPGSVS